MIFRARMARAPGSPERRSLPRGNQEDNIMNWRSIFTMTTVGLICFCASNIARADEVLKYRVFLHITAVQTQDVGDVDGHVLYVGRASGLASFSDGSVGTASLTFTADYVKGAGTFRHTSA
jgi:hypothetical protein